MKIFVIGSLNMDLVIRAPYMPKSGMTIEGGDFMTNAGGKGANQAVACAKLGGDAYMVGCVGAAFGQELVGALGRYGVHTDFVRAHGDVSSGIAVIVVVDGDNRIILDRGANGKIDAALIDGALSQAQAGDFLIVQLEIAAEFVAYALRAGKARGMTTVLNPAPAVSLPGECFADCDYFIPNQSEAEFYTGVYPETEKDALVCAEKLAARGVKNFIVTLGARGSVLVRDGELFAVDAYPVRAVDTTAAGDTYVGALVVRLAEGADVREAMRFASRASALTVTKKGAQQAIPTREEAERFSPDGREGL